MKLFSAIMFACLLSGLTAGSVLAAETDFAMGGAAGQELRLPLGARASGMGGAFVGLADDCNAAAWNPAGLAQVGGGQIGLEHNLYFQGVSLDYLTYAQQLVPGGGLGAYVSYLNYGSMDRVSEVNGQPVADGSYTPYAFTVGAAWGQWFLPNVLAAGATLKIYDQTIDTSSSLTAALDLAGLYRTSLSGLQLGLALQNLGAGVAGYNLPINLKAGAAYELPQALQAGDVLRVLADVNAPFSDAHYVSLSLGTEYVAQHVCAIRLGYTAKDSGGLSGLNGLTAGLGVFLGPVTLDYALVTFGDLGLTHQLMATWIFQAAPTEAKASGKAAKPIKAKTKNRIP